MARLAIVFVILALIVVAAEAKRKKFSRKAKKTGYKCYGDPDQVINYDPNEPCPDISKLEDGKLLKKAKKGKKNRGRSCRCQVTGSTPVRRASYGSGRATDKRGVQGHNRNMVITEDKKWPKDPTDGMVYLPFEVDPTLSQDVQDVIRQAHVDISKESCIRFRGRNATRDENYVYYTAIDGCWSYVGLANIGKQEISLGDGCEYKSVAIHETLHALGFLHEQSRYDRKDYIEVDWRHIAEENWNQFGVGSPDWYTTAGTEYECGSVMHYHKYAFSIDGKKTMDSRRRECRDMGNNIGMTLTDRKKLNILYSC